MDDDVVQNALGEEEESGIQHDDPFRGTASPLGFCKGDLYRTHGNAEGLPIHSADELFHARSLCVCEELPQEAVESGSTEVWSDVHGPSALFSS